MAAVQVACIGHAVEPDPPPVREGCCGTDGMVVRAPRASVQGGGHAGKGFAAPFLAPMGRSGRVYDLRHGLAPEVGSTGCPPCADRPVAAVPYSGRSFVKTGIVVTAVSRPRRPGASLPKGRQRRRWFHHASFLCVVMAQGGQPCRAGDSTVALGHGPGHPHAFAERGEGRGSLLAKLPWKWDVGQSETRKDRLSKPGKGRES